MNHKAPPMRTSGDRQTKRDKTKDSQRRPGGKTQHDTCKEGQLPRLPSQESVTDADQEAEISTTYGSMWPRPPRRLEVTGKSGPRLRRSNPIANGCAGTRVAVVHPSHSNAPGVQEPRASSISTSQEIAAAPFQLQNSRRMPPTSQRKDR